MKRGFLIFFLVMSLLLVSYAIDAKIIEDNSDKHKIDAKINEIDDNESIRVLVKLKDFVPSEVRVNNLAKKELILREKEFEYFNGYSDKLTKEEIENLAIDNRIEQIILEREFRVNLQDSVEIINASNVWGNKVDGINITGIGQTICVIDTGVNYTHPALGGCYGNNNVSSNCKVIGGHDFFNNDSDPLDSSDLGRGTDGMGHGTHVAGIIAASGGITGVAPGAKIIAIKAFNSGGGGFDSDIIRGIDWCVANSTIFNISVISMSFGDSGNYTSYCNDDALADSINAAIAKNISVVVSSGNDGNYTGISSPGCIQNVTAVGASNKNDEIASYSNRNSLLSLIAPGTSINSTYRAGYLEISGTSMSAPHVSGAIAIIKQFLLLNGQTKNNDEIKNLLNETGKRVYDSLSERYYSRINLYDSLILLDNQTPVVENFYPSNNSRFGSGEQEFYCNMSDFQIKNVSLNIWNSTGIYNVSRFDVGSDYYEINLSVNLEEGRYFWGCESNDYNNNSISGENFSIVVYNFIELLSPQNNLYSDNENFTFRCNAELLNNITNVSLNIWNSTGLEYVFNANKTGFSNSTELNYTFENEGEYNWNCLFSDSNGTIFQNSVNYTIGYDISKPNISQESPDVTSSTSNIKFNVSDNIGIKNCSAFVNGNEYLNASEINNNEINYIPVSGLSSSTTYSSYVKCYDLSGNFDNSSTISWDTSAVISVSSSSSGGGGGGGGGITGNTYSLNSNEIKSGNAKVLGEEDKIQFVISSNENNSNENLPKKHTLSLNKIGDNFVNLTIRSEPINLLLYVGESKKISLVSDNYYDLLVRLENIVNGKANITLKEINESRIILNEEGNNEENQMIDYSPEEIREYRNKVIISYIWYIVTGIIIIGVLFYVFRFIDFKNIKKEKKTVLKKIKKKFD